VVIGCLTTGFGFLLARRYDRQVKHRQRELEHRVKEIDTLNLLNKKISQILQKRTLLMPDYVSFDVFDDVHVSIDDYAYLESFTAQNLFYLPNYVMEEFFKNISHRRIILSPEETVQIGGYTFKNGRVIMEQLSDELQTMMNEKKAQLKKISALPIHILRDEEYEFYN
jgi:hypothetical protein